MVSACLRRSASEVPSSPSCCSRPAAASGSRHVPPGAGAGTFREQVERLERTLLAEALTAAGANQSEAARKLGLSRATFLDKLKRYGIG